MPAPAASPSLQLFAVTTALSAGLLFAIQPMVSKTVLPVLGGVPAVWNTCLVFFQAIVLLGYDRDPYVLYAGSNLGSLIALLTYPVLLEPHLRAPAGRATLAHDAGWVACARDDLVLTPAEREAGKEPSRMSALQPLATDRRWRALPAVEGARVRDQAGVATRRRSVSSGRVPRRTGGPHVPVPGLT